MDNLTSNLKTVTLDDVMSQAQVFASSWSLVGGQFDDGTMLEVAEQEKSDLRAMVAQLAGQSAVETTTGWRPINTAPKDGTLFIGYSRTHGAVETRWEHVDGGGHPENGPSVYWWTSPHVEFIDGPYDAPTHWMPLVAPSTRLGGVCTCLGEDKPQWAENCAKCSSGETLGVCSLRQALDEWDRWSTKGKPRDAPFGEVLTHRANAMEGLIAAARVAIGSSQETAVRRPATTIEGADMQALHFAMVTVDDYLLWLTAVQGVRLGAFDVVKRYSEEARVITHRLAVASERATLNGKGDGQ